MQNKIKVGFIQQHNTNDINDNMQRLKKGIEQLAKQGAQLIVLQELHNSLYFCQIETVDNFDLAEPIPGPSTAFFSEIAAANKRRNCNLVIREKSCRTIPQYLCCDWKRW